VDSHSQKLLNRDFANDVNPFTPQRLKTVLVVNDVNPFTQQRLRTVSVVYEKDCKEGIWLGSVCV